MRRRRFSVLGLAAAAVLLAALAPPAAAQPIAIVNPSFELPVFGDGGFGAGTVGWVLGGGDAGTWNPTAGHYPGGVPDGDQIAYSNGGSLSQVLGAVLLPNTTYTLSYFIGTRTDIGAPGYAVSFFAGGNLLGQDVSGVVPAAGTFLPSSIVYTSPGAGPLLGQPLTIVVVSTGIQTNFDDFTLIAQAPGVAPEPTTVALVAGGLLALAGVARRRRPG